MLRAYIDDLLFPTLATDGWCLLHWIQSETTWAAFEVDWRRALAEQTRNRLF
jgi:hypothetical protein